MENTEKKWIGEEGKEEKKRKNKNMKEMEKAGEEEGNKTKQKKRPYYL